VLGELRETLGVDFDRVLPLSEIEALRSNPTALGAFTKNVRTSRALAKRDEVKEAVKAAQTAADAHAKETSRLAALGHAVGKAEQPSEKPANKTQGKPV